MQQQHACSNVAITPCSNAMANTHVAIPPATASIHAAIKCMQPTHIRHACNNGKYVIILQRNPRYRLLQTTPSRLCPLAELAKVSIYMLGRAWIAVLKWGCALELMEGLEDHGFELYIHYTSPQLFLTLHKKGANCSGTAETNRKGFPKALVKKKKTQFIAVYFFRIPDSERVYEFAPKTLSLSTHVNLVLVLRLPPYSSTCVLVSPLNISVVGTFREISSKISCAR